MHLVYPPKLCITIVFDFSWDDCNTLENLETMVMQNSEGENKVHYKRCKVCVKLSYLTANLVPRSPRSCAGLRKWRLRDGPTRRAQEGPLKLPEERQSLKRKGNWRRLLLLGIQTGDTLAKSMSLSHILGFAVTVEIWPKEVVACRDFILGSVATFWVMSLVGIYPGRASIKISCVNVLLFIYNFLFTAFCMDRPTYSFGKW